MNIISRVTINSLKKNKTRTIVTIIGIILCAAMLTAVTAFISSLQHYMYETTVKNDGDWYISIPALDKEELDKLSSDTRLRDIAKLQSLGYAAIDSKNEEKPYIYVGAYDDTFCQTMPVFITEGRLPENSGEIILPQHLWTNAGLKYELETTIELTLGDRIYEDGNILEQSTAFQYDQEKLTGQRKVSYKVVGFYERPNYEPISAPGYTALTYSNETVSDSINVYFKTQKVNQIDAFIQDNSEYCCTKNDDLLMFLGESNYHGFNAVLYSFAAILIVLIMFGSVSLIYNAFAISISERTKQFGLLSSIGATGKQLSSSVFTEALFVASIGIPIGILCGIGGIGITLYFCRDIFDSFYVGKGHSVYLGLHINIPAILIALLIALLTVLISAWIPSRRARRISAIEAIRMSNDITAKQKTVKTSKLTYHIFGLEGTIAKKHFKRSRKKYRTTIISLFMSVVLFVSASSFCYYLSESVEGSFNVREYDLTYMMTPNANMNPEEVYKMLSSVDGITKKAINSSVMPEVEFDDEMLTSDTKKVMENYEIESIPLFLYAVSDEDFLSFLEEKGLDADKYMDPSHPLGIASAKIQAMDYDEGKVLSFDLFRSNPDTIKFKSFDREKYDDASDEQKQNYSDNIPDEFFIDGTLEIGTYMDSLMYGANDRVGSGVVAVYPQSTVKNVLDESKFTCFDMYFTVKDHAGTAQKMQELLLEHGLSTNDFYDLAKNQDVQRNLVLIINIFSYGFIILISLISVANVFNTISTNIALRRREFAMLKSVGMTKRGFNKMMNFECLMYGAKALLYGIPVSILVTFLIFTSANQGYQIKFYMPVYPIIIAVISVFAVVFATMLYSMRKIKKDNPIDALKNENI